MTQEQIQLYVERLGFPSIRWCIFLNVDLHLTLAFFIETNTGFISETTYICSRETYVYVPHMAISEHV